MSLCKYKNALGIPGEGIHAYRWNGIAIMDVLGTILGAVVLSYLFNLPFLYTLIGLFVLGIILHHVFCVRTTVDKALFP
jgi:hypothetical protein